MEQVLLTTTIVAVCALYAAWMLMPAAGTALVSARRAGRAVAEGVSPTRIAPYAIAPTGCACDGCDRSALAKPAAKEAKALGAGPSASISPITFHPRRKR